LPRRGLAPPQPCWLPRRLQASSLRARPAARRPRGGLTARHAVTDEADLSMDVLRTKYAASVKAIREGGADLLDDQDDDYLLRFALEHGDDTAAALKNLSQVVGWRKREGKKIVEAAAKAVEQALAGGKWDNAPVFAAAPHSEKIGKYLTSDQIVVVTLPAGDLCSCIRASAIDDKAMMDEVSVDELKEFFIYAREINNTVANMRSKASGKLVRLLAANDLTNVSKFPDDRFQKALTESSKDATTYYPGLAGPTVILNLPGIVRLLVSFLTPLFPGAVQQRIKFARGPMAYLTNLSDALKEPTKTQFVGDLEAVLAA